VKSEDKVKVKVTVFS